MSRPTNLNLPIVEWSPSAVRSWDLGRGAIQGLPSDWAAVRAALSRRNTFVRALRIPNVSAAETETILRLQIPQSLPLPADDLVFTFRPTSDVSPEGRLVLVVAARAGVVRSLHEDLSARGANAQEVVPAAFGSAVLARALHQSDVAVVEHSPDGWTIDLIVEGELRYSRVIPPETPAEALESEVCRTFGMAGLACGKILAAGGADLPFADLRAAKSTLEVLAGPEVASLQVGLELPEIIAARERRALGNRARLAVLLCVAALALAGVVGLDRYEDASKIRRAEQIESQGTKSLKRLQDSAQSKLTLLNPTIQSLERAFQPEQKASDVLAILTGLAPKSIWLTGITFDRGKPVLLRGIALQSNDVAVFLETLAAQPRFREVKLVFANDSVIEDTTVNQFSISLHAVGNLPLTDPKKKRTVAK